LAIRDFRVLVYEKYDDLTLLDDLTHNLIDGSYSTQLHGGPSVARFTVSSTLTELWAYLRHGAHQGRHFAHVVISEGLDWRWEGRIVEVTAEGSLSDVSLKITAFGYYSSLRDEEIQSDIVYVSKTADFIIKDLLTTYCPSINSDQDGIEAVAGALSPTITDQQYAQDVIVKDIAPLGDSSNNVYHFTIGKDRKPLYKQRDLSEIHWEAYLADMQAWELNQGVQNARKTINADDGATRFTAQSTSDWPSAWPTRDLIIKVPDGIAAASANAASARAAAEKGKVQTSGTKFLIRERPERLATVNPPLGSRGAIKAGEVIRIVDLFGDAQTTLALDQFRTFYIGATTYDMVTDSVGIQPDDPPNDFDILLARTGLELKR